MPFRPFPKFLFTVLLAFPACVSATAQTTALSDLDMQQVKGKWLIDDVIGTDGTLWLANHKAWIGQRIAPSRSDGDDYVAEFALEKRYAQVSGTVTSPYNLSLNGSLIQSLSGGLKPARGTIIIEVDGKELYSKDIGCDDQALEFDLPVLDAEKLTLRMRGPIGLINAQACRVRTDPAVRTSILSPKDGKTVRSRTLKFDWSPINPSTRYWAIVTPQSLDDASKEDFLNALAQPLSNSRLIDLSRLAQGSYTLQTLGFNERGISSPYSLPCSVFLAHDEIASTPSTTTPPDANQKPKDIERVNCSFRTVIDLFGGCEGSTFTCGHLCELCAVAKFVTNCDIVHVLTHPDGIGYPRESGPFVEVYADGQRVFAKKLSQGEHESWVPTFGARDIEVRGAGIPCWGEFYKLPACVLAGPADAETINDRKVWCKWTGPASADAYLVRVVCTKSLTQLEPSAKLVRFAVVLNGRSDSLVDLSEYPSGWYEWQVLSYKEGRVLGTWSEPLRFKLAPK